MLIVLLAKIGGYGHTSYKPNNTIVQLVNALPRAEIVVFHGSWCRDCVRTIPILNKILQNITSLLLTSVPVDHTKRD